MGRSRSIAGWLRLYVQSHVDEGSVSKNDQAEAQCRVIEHVKSIKTEELFRVAVKFGQAKYVVTMHYDNHHDPGHEYYLGMPRIIHREF
jgi:hypothetical protein